MSALPKEQEPTSIVAYESEALSLNQECRSIRVTDQASHDRAAELRVTVKSFKDAFLEFIEPMQKSAYATYKKIMAQRNSVLEPVEANIRALDQQILKFDAEQKLERERLQREADERARQIEAQIQLDRASAAIDAGFDQESVDAILQEPVNVPVERVAETYERSRAIQKPRDNYSAAVDRKDFRRFAAYCLKYQRLELLQVNQAALNNAARVEKESLNIPGVKVVNNPIVASAPRRY